MAWEGVRKQGQGWEVTDMRTGRAGPGAGEWMRLQGPPILPPSVPPASGLHVGRHVLWCPSFGLSQRKPETQIFI